MPIFSDLTINATFTPINIRAKGDAYDNKGDGKVNSRDATYILQHAAHRDVEINNRYENLSPNIIWTYSVEYTQEKKEEKKEEENK